MLRNASRPDPKTQIMKMLKCLAGLVALAVAPTGFAAFLTVDQIIFQNVNGLNPRLLSGTIDYTISAGNSSQAALTFRNTSPDAAYGWVIPFRHVADGLWIANCPELISSVQVPRGHRIDSGQFRHPRRHEPFGTSIYSRTNRSTAIIMPASCPWIPLSLQSKTDKDLFPICLVRPALA